MAGSSVPGTWRHPPADVERGRRSTEIVGLTYGTTDAYGFHGLEAVQALAEQRRGGETGVRAVQCLGGDAVWRALDEHQSTPSCSRPPWRVPAFEKGSALDRKAVPRAQAPDRPLRGRPPGLPLRAERCGRRLDGGVARRRRPEVESTHFGTQEARPAAHFTPAARRDRADVAHRASPRWPVERTLLTSGTLDALLLSLARGGALIETPHLRSRVPADLAVEGAPAAAARPTLGGAVNRIRSRPRHASALTRSRPGTSRSVAMWAQIGHDEHAADSCR